MGFGIGDSGVDLGIGIEDMGLGLGLEFGIGDLD